MENLGNNTDFANKIFQQFMDIFILPEVKKRQDDNKLPKPLELSKAQILFYADGRENEIRINDEVKANMRIKFKEGVHKKIGESIYENDIEGIESITLTDKDDPNCAHATLIKVGDNWSIHFDFKYNKALSQLHIQTAQEFYEAANFSFDKGNYYACIDTLFSASELAAKGLLLTSPDIQFVQKANHKAVHSKYNNLARIGSIKIEHKDGFNKLTNLREKARYLKGDLSITKEDCLELLKIVKSVIEESQSRI